MKTRHLSVLPLLFAALFITSCSGDEMPQQPNSGGTKGNIATATVTFTGEMQTPSTVNKEFNPQTRTAATHTIGNGASVTWTATDKIWVKDDAGVFQQSNAVTFPDAGNEAKGRFDLGSSTFTGTTHAVAYTNTASAMEVEIKTAQTQTAPNNFEHLGASGDCGIAMATGSAGNYKFTLEHKASYLCLLPRTANIALQSCKLMKIEVEADKDIAGTFTFTENGLSPAPTSGEANKITLTCGSDGFPLTNADTDITTNGSYMVIAPGTYNLTIRYWVKDADTGTEGKITKALSSLTCKAGKIHDITANLDVSDYSGWLYYMWDAKQPYWYGHEWNKTGYTVGMDQPTVNGNTGSAYPKDNSDTRWYNIAYNGYGIATSGSQTPLFTPTSASHVPNANEMSWYCMQGDPRWDADELWTTMGHLYKGGIWLKKFSKIAEAAGKSLADLKEKSADGSTDMRTSGQSCNKTPGSILPTASEQADYFYLPAISYYDSGMLYNAGYYGGYWSSSAAPTSADAGAYALLFSSDTVELRCYDRSNGYAAVPFE